MKAIPVIKLQIETEQHVVDARQRARQIARSLGFDNQDQVRLATAASELARNAYQYANGGTISFLIESASRPQVFFITVADRGPGIPHLDSIQDGTYVSKTGMGVGLMGAKKLSDRFEIDTTTSGTTITLGKELSTKSIITSAEISRISEELVRNRPGSPYAEIQQQNTELLRAMEELNSRQRELSELNQELADTNRGVVALYAELDEKASSLQKANEIKTAFLSNMTHEFRTPLTSILSLTRLLTDRIDGDLTEEQEKQVNFIRQSADGLLDLVSDLLDLSKVEAGKVAVKIGEIELSHLLGALRGVFKPLIPATSEVELIIDAENFGGAEPLPNIKFESDEGKIAQILRNLVSNALKFTERGTVTVSYQLQNSASVSGYDQILFRVTDTGLGIPQSETQRIFEDFSQVESTLQSKSRGTGLGLPLSRKLARLLGGDLWVETSVGTGSTFFVRLPLKFEGSLEASLTEEATPTTIHNVPPRSEKKRPLIYLVDDDDASRYVLRNLVRMYSDAEFREFNDSADALAELQKEPAVRPDLIFLDLSMPKMTGFEFLREVKSDEHLSELVICVNTAKILTDDERDFLGQLTVGVLSKERSNNYRANVELRDALLKAELIPESTPLIGNQS